MKIRRTLTAVALGLIVLSTGSTMVSAKSKAPKIDHMALAEKYEKMANDQDEITKEHQQMKVDNRAAQASYPKQTREKMLADMDMHCDSIISDSKKLADEYRSMSMWHKMRAEEEMKK